MPTIVIGADPRLLSVVLKVLLVFTGTLPKLRRVGLTEAAGSTVSVRNFEMPFAVAPILLVVLASTGLVVTANAPDVSELLVHRHVLFEQVTKQLERVVDRSIEIELDDFVVVRP